jgi:glycosyltransferase involved in cell wall biosynthesis
LTRFSAGANGSRIREESGIAPGTFLVSMIGVLRSWKRHDVFLEAVRLLKEQGVPIRAFVVGEGPRRDVIEAEIREKGISDVASITGFREDIPEILAASDAVVLSSDRFEGVPQAILQAMAMEKPVVASPVGGIPEVVRHEETGLVCRAGDPASFAGAITRLRDDPSMGKAMGASGRKIVLASYSLAAMGEKTEAFYSLLALSGKRIA